MSFVNFNNREELSSRKYTKTVVLAALLEAETKNIVKAKNMIANLAEEVELNEALSLFSDKIGAMRTLDHVATLYQPVLEGQFSWLTHDTAEQIGSERENTIDVWMFDNQGNMWYEKRYGGYGEFGGMDYYEVVAKMNGYSDEDLNQKIGKKRKVYLEIREIGIALAFGELETRDKAGKVLFPALMADPKGFNYKRWDFTEEAPNDPNQSWYVEPEWDEEWEEEYESKNEALDFNDPVLMAFRAAKAERDARLAAAASAPKKAKLYGKKRSEAEDKLWTISQELKDLYSDRNQLLRDMEAEAGQLGMEEFEKSGKHDEYGGQLNTVEDKIQDLLAKRGQLEMRLAESVNSNVDNSVAINESDWGTYNTPEGKMVAKELNKAWTTFAKTVDAAHKEWLKMVQKYRGDAGQGSGFRDSEGRDSVVSAMEWYLEKVFMVDKFGGIDYRKYRSLMGESVEVNEAEVDLGLETEGEFMQLYSKLNDLAEETTDTKWRKAIEGIIKGLEGVEAKIGQAANKLGVVPTHEAEEIPGGLAADMSIEDIANHHSVDLRELIDQYEKGIDIELEHTKDKNVAAEIARDHLYEDPKYYTKLAGVEEGNAFGAARAEAIAKGEKTFKVGSEEYDVEGVDKEDKENAKEFVGEDWGGSDQAAMNKSIHRDAGSPRQMPSPFDPKLRSAAEDAVDFYWDEWPEYQDDRDGLIDNAVRSYLRTYFKDQFDALVRMFEEKEETVTEGVKKGDVYVNASGDVRLNGRRGRVTAKEGDTLKLTKQRDNKTFKAILTYNSGSWKGDTEDILVDVRELEGWNLQESADVNEGRSINKIQKEWAEVTSMMKSTVEEWKKAEGDMKGSLLDKLKSLTARKNELEKELDAAVELKDVDAELVGESKDFDQMALDILGDLSMEFDPWEIADMLPKDAEDTVDGYYPKMSSSDKKKLSKALLLYASQPDVWANESKKLSWEGLIENVTKTNEDLRTDLKKYIKANEKELNELADEDNWDGIYDMLRSEFNVKEGSREDDDLITTFNFIF